VRRESDADIAAARLQVQFLLDFGRMQGKDLKVNERSAVSCAYSSS